MPFFTKKPVTIEAVQLTWSNWSSICEFVSPEYFDGGCYLDKDGKETTDCNGRIGLRLKTKEGVMLASENDWIIKGVKGEFYACKPDIFDLTYEPTKQEA